MHPIAEKFLAEIQDYVYETSTLLRVSDWLEAKSRLNGELFSFRDHEFQVEIANEDHPNVTVIKCSQVGLTELSIRMVLGCLAMRTLVALYLMPTRTLMELNVKSRFDPVIEDSPTLTDLLITAANSTRFKRLGSSQLHFGGTYGAPIISIPGDMIVIDELDFCNPEIVLTTESRLQHSSLVDEATGVRGVRRKFSTPTLPDIGVAADYEISDQRKRLVRCRHCGEWFWPSFLLHGVVDGWDKPFTDLEYPDVLMLERKKLIDTARLLCPECHGVVTQANLLPEYREWVAEQPNMTTLRGYHVTPFDLPKYHSAASLLRQILLYKHEKGHFYNFGLGIPYTDATNSILDSVVEECCTLDPVSPEQADRLGVKGCLIGLDVGKISYILVGKPMGQAIHIIWGEQIRLRGVDDTELEDRVVYICKAFGVFGGICDMYPYTDVILNIQKRYPLVTPGDYHLTDAKLPMVIPRESDGSVNLNRTKTLDFTVKRVNSRLFRFARFEDLPLMRQHFQGMRRTERKNDSGEVVVEWTKTAKDDHYFHALNYLNTAALGLLEWFVEDWAPIGGIHQVMEGSQAVVEAEPIRMV